MVISLRGCVTKFSGRQPSDGGLRLPTVLPRMVSELNQAQIKRRGLARTSICECIYVGEHGDPIAMQRNSPRHRS